MNVHDSERIAGLLETAGYEVTTESDQADLIVLNTCSVRERAQEKLFTRISGFTAPGDGPRPLIAVVGCVAQQEGGRLLKRAPMVDLVVGTQALGRLPMMLEEVTQDTVPRVDINPYDDVSFPLGLAVRQDPVKAYVTIIEGCNDFCAFCVVPYTRGQERMRSASEILDEVREATAHGHSEIHLLGQIVNHYQAPDLSNCDFSGLLELVHDVPGVKRIRFASPHPRHVTQRLITAIRDLPKVCKHLHLPVQSGSSKVLTEMRRRYSRESYLELISEIRQAIPNIALSTDMIVGFPGETDGDFAETLSLTKIVGYHSMFSFKYSERPNTLAAKRMPDTVPEEVKARRLFELQALQKGLQVKLHELTIGTTVDVLVDSQSRRRDTEYSGRTSSNTVVNFPGESHWIGRIVNVRVLRVGPNSLWGRTLRDGAEGMGA